MVSLRSWLSVGLATPVLGLAGGQIVQAMPAAATALPEDTAMALTINTRPAVWSSLDRFRLFSMFLDVDAGETTRPGPGLLLLLKVDYDEAVAPWVGDEVILALLPFADSEAGSPEIDDQLVMVAPIQDDQGIPAFMTAVEASMADRSFTRQVYDGVEILVWDPVLADPAETDFDGPVPVDPEQEAELERITSPSSDSERDSSVEDLAAGELAAEEPIEAEAFAVDQTETIEATETDDDGLAEFPDAPNSRVIQPGLALGILPDYVVLGQNPQVVQAIIDQQRAERHLGQQANFQRTVDNPRHERSLLSAYGDIGEILRHGLAVPTAETLPIPFPLPLPELTQADVDAIAAENITLELFVTPQPRGIEAQSRIYYGTPLPEAVPPERALSDQLMTLMPGATALMFSGYDLARVWQGIAMTLEAIEPAQVGLDLFREGFTQFTGLDFDTDVMGWMDGEFALLLFPTRSGFFPSLSPDIQVGLGLMLQTSDRTTADNTLAVLTETLDLFNIPTTTDRLDQTEITSVGIGPFPATDALSYGWANDNVLALSSGLGPTAQLIDPNHQDTLANHSTFRTATGSFPQPNQGYGYLNMGAILTGISPLIDNDDPFFGEITRFLSTIHSLSFTTAYTEDYVQANFLSVLAPTP